MTLSSLHVSLSEHFWYTCGHTCWHQRQRIRRRRRRIRVNWGCRPHEVLLLFASSDLGLILSDLDTVIGSCMLLLVNRKAVVVRVRSWAQVLGWQWLGMELGLHLLVLYKHLATIWIKIWTCQRLRCRLNITRWLRMLPHEGALLIFKLARRLQAYLHLLVLKILRLQKHLQLLDLFLACEKPGLFARNRWARAISVSVDLVRLIKLTVFQVCIGACKIHQATWLPFNGLNGVRVLKWILRHVAAALFPNKSLKLLDPSLLVLNQCFCLHRDPVVCVKLLLQLYNCLVSLIQSRCQRNHNVSLLQQKLLISINLGFTFFNLSPLPFKIV